jgi:hypothetical protein
MPIVYATNISEYDYGCLWQASDRYRPDCYQQSRPNHLRGHQDFYLEFDGLRWQYEYLELDSHYRAQRLHPSSKRRFNGRLPSGSQCGANAAL